MRRALRHGVQAAPGRALRAALFPLLLVVLFGLFLGFVTSFGGGPVDYVFVGFMLAVGVLATLIVTVRITRIAGRALAGLGLVRRRRRRLRRA